MRSSKSVIIDINTKLVLLLVLSIVAISVNILDFEWLSRGRIHLFLLQFLSLFIEAAPFLLLGSIVSGLIEEYIEPEFLLRFVPKKRIPRVIAGSLLGFVFPVCECGVIPVVRRLMGKGMPSTMALAFLLAAPVMNPIVLFGTYKAFGFSPMLLWRIIGTVAIACIVAACIAPSYKNDHNIPKKRVTKNANVQHALRHAANDFLSIGAYLVIGSFLASAAQSFIPPNILLPIGTHVLFSVVAMELLAFVMSVCSSVDAFIALGFVHTFTGGSILSFLVFGPMIDIKNTLLFLGILPKHIVIKLLILPLILSTILGVLANINGLTA